MNIKYLIEKKLKNFEFLSLGIWWICWLVIFFLHCQCFDKWVSCFRINRVRRIILLVQQKKKQCKSKKMFSEFYKSRMDCITLIFSRQIDFFYCADAITRKIINVKVFALKVRFQSINFAFF